MEKQQQSPSAVRGQGMLEWYEALISAALVLVLIFSFFFRIIQVDGRSMVPTLTHGDKLIVWAAGYTPQRGDVVIVDSYTVYGKPLVKRIIAKGGDTISIDYDAGTVTVNGELLQEDYVAAPTYLGYDVQFPFTVPEGTLFVMGDNRNESLDSRSSYVGCIDEREILGTKLLQNALMTLNPDKPTILLSHYPFTSLHQDEKKYVRVLRGARHDRRAGRYERRNALRHPRGRGRHRHDKQ